MATEEQHPLKSLLDHVQKYLKIKHKELGQCEHLVAEGDREHIEWHRDLASGTKASIERWSQWEAGLIKVTQQEVEELVEEHWDDLMEVLKDRPDDVVDALGLKLAGD